MTESYDEEETETEEETPAIKAIRQAQKDADKRASAAEKELAKLREERRQERVAAVASELKLSDEALAKIREFKPEADADEIRGLAGIFAAQAPKETPEEFGAPPAAGDPPEGRPKMTREEFDVLAYNDPAAASQAVREGRVEWNNPEGVARTLATKGF